MKHRFDRFYVQQFLAIARSDNFPSRHGDAQQFELPESEFQMWNINTRTDLIIAKRELGVPITPDEATYELHNPRNMRRELE